MYLVIEYHDDHDGYINFLDLRKNKIEADLKSFIKYCLSSDIVVDKVYYSRDRLSNW